MARTNGFNGGIADVVTFDQPFTDYVTGTVTPSTCIVVPTIGEEGSIVYVDTAGNLRYWPYAFVGYNPISAIKIMSSGVVNGQMRETTATPLYWYAGVSVA